MDEGKRLYSVWMEGVDPAGLGWLLQNLTAEVRIKEGVMLEMQDPMMVALLTRLRGGQFVTFGQVSETVMVLDRPVEAITEEAEAEKMPRYTLDEPMAEVEKRNIEKLANQTPATQAPVSQAQGGGAERAAAEERRGAAVSRAGGG